MKKSSRKILAILLSSAMIFMFAFSACTPSSPPADENPPAQGGEQPPETPPDDGQVYTIRMGCATVLPSHPNYFMEIFKEAIESKSDKFKVELYPANQLGSNTEMIQGLQNGTVQTVVLPVGFFTPIAPIMNVLDIPRLVPDSLMQYEMLNDSDVGVNMNNLISEKGMLPLGYLYCVEKEMALNKDVKSFADLKGLKIRGFDSTVAQNEIRSYDATPVSMSTADVAMALQQGAINGVLADVTMIAPLKLYEQAPYLVKAPFSPTSNVIMFSKMFLDGLPEDLRTMLEETVTECRLETYTYTVDYIQQCYEQIEEGGGIVTTPDEEFYENLTTAAQTVREQFLNDQPEAKDIYDQIVKYVDDHK